MAFRGLLRGIRHALNRRAVRQLRPSVQHLQAMYMATGRPSRRSLKTATAHLRYLHVQQARSSRIFRKLSAGVGATATAAVLTSGHLAQKHRKKKK